MKKIAIMILIIFMSTLLLTNVGYAIDIPLRVVVNGEEVKFPDAQPFIDANGRTQTPARFIGEALGVFEKSETTLVLFIGKREYEVNGQKKQMDTEALLIEGRTFVPARYVAEAFGATVSWNAAIKTVYIDMDKTGKVEVEGDTREVAGFIVPKGIDLMVAGADEDSGYEAVFKMIWRRYYYKSLVKIR